MICLVARIQISLVLDAKIFFFFTSCSQIWLALTIKQAQAFRQPRTASLHKNNAEHHGWFEQSAFADTAAFKGNDFVIFAHQPQCNENRQ
jgi:hypothetical protein